MKILKVEENLIDFDDGSKIIIEKDIYDSYADCKQIEELAFDYDFKNIEIEFVVNFGFRFGDDNIMFGVPCYDNSGAYYSTKFTIIYQDKNKKIIKIEKEGLFT